MATTGFATLDFGPYPGVSDVSLAITGQAGIVSGSVVEAWIQPAAVADGFSADGVPLNANVYMTRGANFSGIADSKLGIYSVWLFPINFSLVSATHILKSGGGSASLDVQFAGAQKTINVNGLQGINFDVSLSAKVESVYPEIWHHVLASWDIGNNVGSLWINDVLVDNTISRTADEALTYSACTDWTMGDSTGTTSPVTGIIAEHYFAPGQYLDFTVAANRRKFNTLATDSIRPVDLGSDGSLPTGVAPILYQHIAAGEACANFLTNRGTGGNMALVATTAYPVAQLPSYGLGLAITPGHSIDEHLTDAPFVCAGNIVAGTGFTIYGVAPTYPEVADVPHPEQRNKQNTPRVCGKWNVGWVWS